MYTRTDTTINGINVTLVAMSRDEMRNRRNERTELRSLGRVNSKMRGEDFDNGGDFENSFPQTAAALKAAGADLDQAYVIYEVQR